MRISDWSSDVCSSDLPIGLVANVGNALDPFVLGRFGDLFHQAGFADLIGNFGQYHGSTVAAPFLDFVARTHDDRSTPRLIGRTRDRLAADQPARRNIRAGNDLETFNPPPEQPRVGKEVVSPFQYWVLPYH